MEYSPRKKVSKKMIMVFVMTVVSVANATWYVTYQVMSDGPRDLGSWLVTVWVAIVAFVVCVLVGLALYHRQNPESWMSSKRIAAAFVATVVSVANATWYVTYQVMSDGPRDLGSWFVTVWDAIVAFVLCVLFVRALYLAERERRWLVMVQSRPAKGYWRRSS